MNKNVSILVNYQDINDNKMENSNGINYQC